MHCKNNTASYHIAAMEYYRKATKMVPDIDIQMTARFRQSVEYSGAYVYVIGYYTYTDSNELVEISNCNYFYD